MKRDLYWDSLKFILIFLVVLAHCIASYRPAGGINQAYYNFLCTFLMPMFIFVSGMFSQMKEREKYKSGIRRIFETYVVLQIIEVGMKIMPQLIHNTTTLKSVTVAILTPQFGSWYLLSLTFWRIIVLYISKDFCAKNPTIILFACICTSLLGGFIPVGKTLSLQRTMTYLPFFFMGYYVKNIDIKKYVSKIPSLLAIGVLFSALLIYVHYINLDYSFILYGWSSYWSIAGFSPIGLFLARCIFIISSIITGLTVMRLTLTKATFFSKWGRITLFIYAYHLIAVRILRHAIRYNFFPQNEWLLWVLPIFITMGLILLSHIKFLHILLNPVSYMTEKAKEKEDNKHRS